MNASWKIGWRVDQTWVKNNRDAEYHLFGIPIWDQDTPTFAGALHLLALALSDNALLGYNSADGIWQQRIPPGQNEMPLKWNKKAENMCIVRETTASVVSEASITTRQFNKDFRRVMNNADYFKTATIHAVRRALGAVVDGSPGLDAHKTQEIYGQDYVAHITRVDTVNSLLGNEPDTRLADYFQGFGQFNERGLPSELPAEWLIELQYGPTLMEIDREIEVAKACGSAKEIKNLEKRKKNEQKKMYTAELKKFQVEWVQKRQEWNIMTRGKLSPDVTERITKKRALCNVMPELGRLVKRMSSDKPLTFDDKLQVTKDLHALSTRDDDVVYLPGGEPVDGCCPASTCGASINQ
ncbi:hypothetical protein BDV12DRAFT_190940 [Aspergillus spectabilis]